MKKIPKKSINCTKKGVSGNGKPFTRQLIHEIRENTDGDGAFRKLIFKMPFIFFICS